MPCSWWYWKTTFDKYFKTNQSNFFHFLGVWKSGSLHLFPSFHVLPNRVLCSYLYSYFCISFQLIQGLCVLLIQFSNLWYLVELLKKIHKPSLLMFKHCEYQLFSLISAEDLLTQVSNCHLWNVVPASENVEAASSHWRMKAARHGFSSLLYA